MTPSESHALMRREINEQADILLSAAETLALEANNVRPKKTSTLWVGGCGDSLFAAQSLARHFRGLGWDMRPCSAAEMLYEADIRAGDAVIGVSISGATRRTVEAMARATAEGAATIAVTLNADSPLARSSQATLILPFRPISRAIPHGLDYYMTLLALASVAGEVPATRIADFFHARTASQWSSARTVAEGLVPGARFFFLGAGSALGSANYGAAKLHEAAGIAAWSFEAENFGHGAHFMLRPGDHVVLYGAGGPGDGRTAALHAGLERLTGSLSHCGLAQDRMEPLISAFGCALHAQTLCLAIAEQLDLDVMDPGRGSAAAEVQREWFGWNSDGA